MRIWWWTSLIATFYSPLNGVSSKSAHSLILLAALNGREMMLLRSKLCLHMFSFISSSSEIDAQILDLGFSFKQQKKVRNKAEDIFTCHGNKSQSNFFKCISSLFQWTCLILISRYNIFLPERCSFGKVQNSENSLLMAVPTPSYYQNNRTVMYYSLMVTDTVEAEL